MVQFASITGHDFPFYFNLTRPVGRGYRGAPADDVALVQFCFAIGAANAAPTSGANPDWEKVRGSWKAVQVTGQNDDATQASIDAWQAYRRKKFGAAFEVDGIVSVARTGTGVYSGQHTTYDIVHLNAFLNAYVASLWPRVDKHGRCPPVLGRAIRAALGRHVTA